AGVCAAEQVSDDRQAAHDGHFGDVDLGVGHDDATHDDGRAVSYGYAAFRGLCIQGRHALNSWNTGIDLGVFDQNFHEYRAIGRDLRRHFQLQHRVDVLHGNGVVDGGLDRNLHTLLYGGFFVVLRHDARLGEQFTDALGFRGRNEEIHGKIWRTVDES